MALNESLGDIKIQNDVVATIASIAMTEVEGVVSVTGKRFLDPLLTPKGPDKGIKVEVTENRAHVTIDVKVLYGHEIYDTAHRLQQRVKNAVEQMSGLMVEAINVNVRDIVLDTKPGADSKAKTAAQPAVEKKTQKPGD
jgi:uncharacterized alkaline shock family protein YloU